MGNGQSSPAVYDHDARGIYVMFVVVLIISMSARVASRFIQKAPLGVDDALVYLTFAMNLGLLSLGFSLVNQGAVSEKALATFQPADALRMQKHLIAYGFLYILSTITVKLSGLFLLRRIFTMNELWFRIGWWINVLFIFPGWATATLTITGIQAAAGSLLASDLTKYGIPATAALTGLSDIMVLALPLRSITRLKLPRAQKIGLSAIFTLGLISTCVAIARTALSSIKVERNWNVAYSSYLEMITAAAELMAGFMCACLPVIKPVLRKIPDLGSSISSFLTGFGTKNRTQDSSSRSTFQYGDSPSKLRGNGITRADYYGTDTIPLTEMSDQNVSANTTTMTALRNQATTE